MVGLMACAQWDTFCFKRIPVTSSVSSTLPLFARVLPVSVNISALCVHDMSMSLPPSVFLEFVAAKIYTFADPISDSDALFRCAFPVTITLAPKGPVDAKGWVLRSMKYFRGEQTPKQQNMGMG